MIVISTQIPGRRQHLNRLVHGGLLGRLGWFAILQINLSRLHQKGNQIKDSIQFAMHLALMFCADSYESDLKYEVQYYKKGVDTIIENPAS